MATKKGKTPRRETIDDPMVRKTIHFTQEMLDVLDEAARANESGRSYEVRESIGQRFRIPEKRRHGGS